MEKISFVEIYIIIPEAAKGATVTFRRSSFCSAEAVSFGAVLRMRAPACALCTQEGKLLSKM